MLAVFLTDLYDAAHLHKMNQFDNSVLEWYKITAVNDLLPSGVRNIAGLVIHPRLTRLRR